jgi:CDI immunity proteins
MQPEKNWRKKSLEVLEKQNWGDPATAPTDLIKHCIELTKIPAGDFSSSDLRLMIGQRFTLEFLIPLALEKLTPDIFIETDYYEGDLLSNVLNIDISFWDDNKEYWKFLNELIKEKRDKLAQLKISIAKFDDCKFADK